MVKILVADDHPLVREGLRSALRGLEGEEPHVVEADSAAATLDLAKRHPDADLILLDLAMPGAIGFDLLDTLRERHPAIPVVVVSGTPVGRIARDAIARGASGFVPKSCASEVMLSALRLVFSGGVYLPPDLPAEGQESPASSATGDRPTPDRAQLGLTQRQLQVMALLLQGKSNKVIGRELGLAEGTVKIHVAAVLRALGVETRTQAVLAATRLGFTPEMLREPPGR